MTEHVQMLGLRRHGKPVAWRGGADELHRQRLILAGGQMAMHQCLRPQRLDQVDRELQPGPGNQVLRTYADGDPVAVGARAPAIDEWQQQASLELRRRAAAGQLGRQKTIVGAPMKPATYVSAGRANTSIGVASCAGRPRCSTRSRSPSVMASTWSWVTNRLVTPSRRCSRRISARIARRSLASRLESGSSNRNSFG